MQVGKMRRRMLGWTREEEWRVESEWRVIRLKRMKNEGKKRKKEKERDLRSYKY